MISLVEICYYQGLIDAEQLLRLDQTLLKNGYGLYLMGLVGGEVVSWKWEVGRGEWERSGRNGLFLLMGGQMDRKPYFIRAEWDDEAAVWVASSDDVPGLATEEETLEGLVAKLAVMVPELLEANAMEAWDDTPFELFSRRFVMPQRAHA